MSDFAHLIQSLDQYLFFWINLSFASVPLDHFMIWMTTKTHWFLPGGMVWLWLIVKGGKKGRILAILVVLGIILADQISSGLMKPGFERYRPCKTLEGFRLLVTCGSRYGFPSSHASNIAAIGALFLVFFPRSWPFWIPMIFIIGISRIYVGVHYPMDVLGGWLLGIVIAAGLIGAVKRLGRRYPFFSLAPVTPPELPG